MIKVDYNSGWYQEFIKNNSGKGNLKIRAYAASEALPVSGLVIVVSTMINNKEVEFFEGVTDASGMIDTISLPAPKLESSNLVVPLTTNYKIVAYFIGDKKREYTVNMYDGVCVVQNINVVFGDNYVN